MDKHRLSDSITAIVINALHYFEQVDSGKSVVSVADTTSTLDAAYMRYCTDPVLRAKVTMLVVRLMDVCTDSDNENAKLREQLNKSQRVCCQEFDKCLDACAPKANHWKERAEAAEAKLSNWTRRSESCESKLGQLEANEQVMILKAKLKAASEQEVTGMSLAMGISGTVGDRIAELERKLAEQQAWIEKMQHEWARQKKLFPVLESDDWFDLAMREASNISSAELHCRLHQAREEGRRETVPDGIVWALVGAGQREVMTLFYTEQQAADFVRLIRKAMLASAQNQENKP